jgi:hypothetical protein
MYTGPAAREQRQCETRRRQSRLTERQALPEADDDTPADEQANLPPRRERLHERCHDDEDGARGHAGAAARVVSQRPSEEPSRDDGADRVRGVDGTV